MWQRSLSALAVACLAGCGAAQAAEPNKIGAVLPFSGGVELYGEQAKLGLECGGRHERRRRRPGTTRRDRLSRRRHPTPHRREAARKVVEEDDVLAVVGPITSQNRCHVPCWRPQYTAAYATNYEGGKCNRYMLLQHGADQELDRSCPT